MQVTSSDPMTQPDSTGLTNDVGTALSEKRAIVHRFLAVAHAEGATEMSVAPLQPLDTYMGEAPRPLRPWQLSKLVIAPIAESFTGPQVLAGRYESTAPLARLVAEGRIEMPVTLSYADEQIRLEPVANLGSGRHRRNFVQLGIETHARHPDQHHVNIDRALSIMAKFKASFHVEAPLILRFSHTALTKRIAPDLTEYPRRQLLRRMEKGNVDAIREFTTDHSLDEEQQRLVDRFMACRNVDLAHGIKLAHELGELEAEQDLERMLALGGQLEHCTALCQLDLTVHRDLGFYRGLVLQADLGRHREVAGGGDYTGLVECFGGEPISSFGWAIGLDRLAAAIGKDVSA